MLTAVVVFRLECDLCGKVANLDGQGGIFAGWASEGPIDKGWRIQGYGQVKEEDGGWLELDSEALYIADEPLSFMAVCPDCDPAELCEGEGIEYDPEDWGAED